MKATGLRQFKGILLSSSILFAAAAVCSADLDEKGFAHYLDGEVLGQNDWLPQGLNEGVYENAPGRGEIRSDLGKQGKSLIWRSGFEGREQTRMVKRFPATTGTKVDIKFAFIPGNANVGGQLFFDQGKEGGVGIRFIKHTLHVTNFGDSAPVDTRQTFEVSEPNQVELQLDFETHRMMVFLNGSDAGSFALPPALMHLVQLNFFGGGGKFESALSNLSIESVDDFKEPLSSDSRPAK